MYGVPPDLDLSFLIGAEVIQVCLGVYQVQLHFHPAASLSIEGGWELRDAAGARIDRRHEGAERPPYQLHRLLGRGVKRVVISAPDWIELHFDGGYTLRVLDDSSDYESFQIQPGDIIV